MTLFINTKDKEVIEVSLKKNGQIINSLTGHHQFGSQLLLPLITKLLKKAKLDFADLEKIEVHTGPGSFTGLRVGVSVANALGFSLGLPVNGKKIETDLIY